jgi:hypothetical protein
VTNACNAACDFCNFARGKVGAANLRWIDADRFEPARDILYRRYRDSSVMLHFAVSLGDSMDRLRTGDVRGAVNALVDARNLTSLGVVVENAHVLSRLARLG